MKVAETSWTALVWARRRQVAVGLAFGAGAFALALWGVPLGEIGAAMVGASPVWLLAVAELRSLF